MKKILVAVIAMTFSIIACSDTGTIPNAFQYDMQTMTELPGYGWFSEEYNLYNVDQSKIQAITENFNPALHKIVFFTRPSCSCPGAHKMFPAIYKILMAAGIPETSMEFYSFSSIESKHIYDSLITVAALPAFYVMKSGVPVYSIADTLNRNSYYQVQYPILYEDLIFEGLKK